MPKNAQIKFILVTTKEGKQFFPAFTDADEAAKLKVSPEQAKKVQLVVRTLKDYDRMMVNGNLGVGVAVAGSFSLVRFRSLPGKSTDIAIVFLAMGAGLATGMGYVFFAVAMSAVVCLIFFASSRTSFLDSDPTYRYLRITIPEDLEYASVFDGIFKEYTKYSHLEQMRTVNLGSMICFFVALFHSMGCSSVGSSTSTHLPSWKVATFQPVSARNSPSSSALKTM